MHLRCHCYNAMGLHEAPGQCVYSIVVRTTFNSVLLSYLMALSTWTRNRVVLRKPMLRNWIPEEQTRPGTPEQIYQMVLSWGTTYGIGEFDDVDLHNRVSLVQSVAEETQFPRKRDLLRHFYDMLNDSATQRMHSYVPRTLTGIQPLPDEIPENIDDYVNSPVPTDVPSDEEVESEPLPHIAPEPDDGASTVGSLRKREREAGSDEDIPDWDA